MTTFTKVSDSEKPLIEVDVEKKLSKIDPLIYGHFTEYVQCPFPCCQTMEARRKKKEGKEKKQERGTRTAQTRACRGRFVSFRKVNAQ